MRKVILTTLVFCTMFSCKKNETPTTTQDDLKGKDSLANAGSVYKIAKDAYIWSYPMVSVAITGFAVTDTPKALPNAHAPLNSFGSVATLFTADDKDVVSSNVDTMYSSAFLDLTQGAALISVPDTNGRYYSMMLTDAYTNVFDYIGSRATGTKAGQYLIVGPDWKGEIPKSAKKVFKAPTNLVWVIGRTLVDGNADVPNVHKIQAGYKVTIVPPVTKSPSWRERLKVPALTPKTPPVDLVNNMDWKTYFTWVGELMKDNPVPASQKAYVDEFKKIGLTFDKGFDASSITAEQQKDIEKAMKDGLEEMKKRGSEKIGTEHEGWSYSLDAGTWGNDYLMRGAIALRSLGQNTAQEAVYINTLQDKDGNPLDASKNNYTVTFPKGELPPADAFWSITMYNDQNFFVKNPINRLAIGNRTKEMKPNKDGSLTIYFQKYAPAKENLGNWLPAPNGKFRLSLRLYVPNNKILNGGSWVPPGVVKSK